MRLLHTADWHLGDRLRHVDRAPDLRKAVEQICNYALAEQVDVLLVAGDLFSELIRSDTFHEVLAHLSEVFRPFLLGGGTIVAVTGNHDNEVYCRTLCRAFQLAAPLAVRSGDLLPSGRLYLAARRVHFCLSDARGLHIQFVCMPYPTGGAYLEGTDHRYGSLAEKNRTLRARYQNRLDTLRARLKPRIPAILAAHVNALAASSPELFRLTSADDVLVDTKALLAGWSYAALGHIHRPQCLLGKPSLRYAGSIERLDIGERFDRKSVVCFEMNEQGLVGPPRLLPLDATPFYDVRIRNARQELPQLAQRYPDAGRALVRCRVSYQPGVDNLHEILAEVGRIFPRCYERTWAVAGRPTVGDARPRVDTAPGSLGETGVGETGWDLDAEELSPADGPRSLEEIVLGYLKQQLDKDDLDREQLLTLAGELLQDVT